MIAGHERLNEDERAELLYDMAREAVHARPDERDGFPCGLPLDAPVQVAAWPEEMTCADCVAAERARAPQFGPSDDAEEPSPLDATPEESARTIAETERARREREAYEKQQRESTYPPGRHYRGRRLP